MQVGYTVLEGCGKSLLDAYALNAVDFAFARNLVIWLFSLGLTRASGLSLQKDALWTRNWKTLTLCGLAGTVSMILTNLCLFYLPLTIWFVLLCSNPFFIAIAAYFLIGERMGVPSVVATVLSFAAIVALTLAKPPSQAGDASYHYLLGVVLALTNVLMIVVVVLTTR